MLWPAMPMQDVSFYLTDGRCAYLVHDFRETICGLVETNYKAVLLRDSHTLPPSNMFFSFSLFLSLGSSRNQERHLSAFQLLLPKKRPDSQEKKDSMRLTILSSLLALGASLPLFLAHADPLAEVRFHFPSSPVTHADNPHLTSSHLTSQS